MARSDGLSVSAGAGEALLRARGDRPTGISVAVPSRNAVGQDLCGDLAAALFRMKQDLRYAVTVRIWPGFGLDVVRNRVVAAFLETDDRFLVMVDDDIVPPDDLLDMVAHDADIVGALCYAWAIRSGPFIVAYTRNGDGGYARLRGVENTGLRDVALVGGGCFMVHRRVFEALPAPWFRFETDALGAEVVLSEDFVFCREAARRGFRVLLDTDRICGHIKRVDLKDVAALLAARKGNPLFDALE